MKNEVEIQPTIFTKIVLFFMCLVFTCLILAGWLWLQQHPWLLSTLFTVH